MTEQLRIDAFIKPIYEGRTFTGDHQMLVTFTLHSWIAPAETLERDDMYGRRLNDAVFTSLFDGTGGSRRLADDIAADADLFHHFSLLAPYPPLALLPRLPLQDPAPEKK